MRILGVDPGLTRCGVGIIDVSATRSLTLVEVRVLTTPSSMPLASRLLHLRTQLIDLLDEFTPDRVVIERVFAQANLRTVMGTAQVSGLALVEAAARNLPVDMHTPSEVKAAVSGSGRANKAQVAAMVARILSMETTGLLPDATDALALAITNAWRGGSGVEVSHGAQDANLTSAQRKWREAERLSRRRG